MSKIIIYNIIITKAKEAYSRIIIAKSQARSIALCIAKDIHQYALDHAAEYEDFLRILAGDVTDNPRGSADSADHAATPYSA